MGSGPIEIEVAFGFAGESILWRGGNEGCIQDGFEWWQKVFNTRSLIAGTAHTHPWKTPAYYSRRDEATFAGWEATFGRRMLWWIVTLTEASCFQWNGSVYAPLDNPPFVLQDADLLCTLSLDGGIDYGKLSRSNDP